MCLLHEKPFAGVNGSGKHINWSLSTDTGENLFSPGKTPSENAEFLLFLAAFIKGVDEYQELLRSSVAFAGNDHRLGAQEAPPAIISIFLGSELEGIIDAIVGGSGYSEIEHKSLRIGVDVLPAIPQDTTDRNRTSPVAFTGNKFEFRMLGSSNSIACANIMLNASVAESLRQYADRLEGASDFEGELHTLIREVVKKHKRIIFNGNGYDDAWIQEATEKRGLLNLRTTPDALPCILEKKNTEMLTRLGVFTMPEILSRYEITLENYCKTVNIEALTMVDMARKQILPAAEEAIAALADACEKKLSVCKNLSGAYEKKQITALSALVEEIDRATEELENAEIAYKAVSDVTEASQRIRDVLLPKMAALRAVADEAETMIPAKYRPFPDYADLLFGVR